MQSSAIQPPCALCRRCGAFNETIYVPHDYVVGGTSTHGMEVFKSVSLFHHLDQRLMDRRPAPANSVHPMLNIGAQNNSLPFR